MDCPAIAALALCVCVFLVFVGVAYFKYTHFGFEGWDLAFFSQSLWNLAHGQQYSSIFDRNFFANHTNIIAFLFVPLYVIFPHPLTLLVLRGSFFTAAAYLFYAMARQRIGAAALFLMLLYIFYPPNLLALLYEFDYENLAPLILFALIYFFEKEKWAGFLGMSLALILTKENFPLTIIAFGFLGLFTKKNKLLWGLAPIGLGALSFFILTSIVVPFYTQAHREYHYVRNYGHLGQSFFDIIKNIFIHPDLFLSLFRDLPRILWLVVIFEPLCFIPLFNLPMMLLASPILAQHFLSANLSEQSIYYYIMTVAPFIFWGAVRVLAKFRPAHKKIYFGLLIAMGIASAVMWGWAWRSLAQRIYPLGNAPAHMVAFKSQMLKAIPPKDSVVASFIFLPELSLRPNVYAFYRIYGLERNYGAAWYIASNVPADVQFAYIDFFDPFLFRELRLNPDSHLSINKFFQQNWSVKDATENVVLFERKDNPLRLVEVSPQPFLNAASLNLRVDHKFTLLSVAKGVELSQNKEVLPLTFYWKAEEGLGADYAVRISVKQDQRVVLTRTFFMGYAIYPSRAWQSGDHIKEHYWLYAPGVDLSQAQLTLEFLKMEARGPRRVLIENQEQLDLNIKDLF